MGKNNHVEKEWKAADTRGSEEKGEKRIKRHRSIKKAKEKRQRKNGQ